MKRAFCSVGGSWSRARIALQAGFTLIEMLVVIAISAILVAMAAPSMRNLIESNGVANSVNGFIGAMSFARSEALKRGVPVTLCRSANADTTSTPSCQPASDWQSGWIVFVDFNANRVFDSGAGDILLRAEGSVERGGTIVQNTTASLQFQATGLLTSGASRFDFSPPSGTDSLRRCVVVGFGGRARLVTGQCS